MVAAECRALGAAELSPLAWTTSNSSSAGSNLAEGAQPLMHTLNITSSETSISWVQTSLEGTSLTPK